MKDSFRRVSCDYPSKNVDHHKRIRLLKLVALVQSGLEVCLDVLRLNPKKPQNPNPPSLPKPEERVV
jgi:hypothetical protein